MRGHAQKNVAKPKRQKTKLGLPDLDHSKSAVLDSLRSRESKRGYRHAIDEFIQWYCSEPRLSFSKVVVTRYRIFLENRNLAAGTINGRLAAVRRLAYEAADAGLLSPELAAGVRRVKGVKKLGVRLGNWLTAEEARRFLQSPPADTLKGKRDRKHFSGSSLRKRRISLRSRSRKLRSSPESTSGSHQFLLSERLRSSLAAARIATASEATQLLKRADFISVPQ